MRISEVTKTRLKETAMEMDVNELYKSIRNTMTVWSWGAKNFTNLQNKGLAFKVNGHLFSGNVAITLNGSDLFDVDFCNIRGNQTDKTPMSLEDLFVDQLIDLIDEQVEKVPAYGV
jgi:hypothetical protein